MDDWKVGDLALCVYGHDWTPSKAVQRLPDEAPAIVSALFPSVGSVWRVNVVKLMDASKMQGASDPGVLMVDGFVVYIGLDGQPSPYLYDSRHFRKVTPPEADEFDCEVIDLMTKQPAEVR